MNNIFGYKTGTSFAHRLTGSTKLIGFLVLTLAGMLSFDLRFLTVVALTSIAILINSKVKWRDVSLLVKFVAVFAIMNLALIYLFAPQYGVDLFHSKTVLLGNGGYALTLEQVVYELIVLLKYFLTLPLALIFLLTTNPSEFAAGMNKIRISYRISYAFALTLRYIPDIQSEYHVIANAQQARGFELSKKAKLGQRIKGAAGIILPLVFSSLERIDQISRAMDLRRFGKGKKRTWYYEQIFGRLDWIALSGVALILILEAGLIYVNGGRFWYPFG